MSNYRKIWEEKNGPIPVDATGRKMEIHHLDGKRSNNSLSNLVLLTIDEHYKIHYGQGDWAACQSIANRMKISPEDKSKLCSELAKKRVMDGTHHFLDPKFIKKDSERKSRDRSGSNHPLFNKPVSDATKCKRSKSHKELVEQGIHHLQQQDHRDRMREKSIKEINEGTHLFQQSEFRKKTNEAQKRLLNENKHPFNSVNRVDPNKIMIFCSHCQKEVSKPAFGRFHKH
jgi:hypothetical protein